MPAGPCWRRWPSTGRRPCPTRPSWTTSAGTSSPRCPASPSSSSARPGPTCRRCSGTRSRSWATTAPSSPSPPPWPRRSDLDNAASLWVVREFARALGMIAPGGTQPIPRIVPGGLACRGRSRRRGGSAAGDAGRRAPAAGVPGAGAPAPGMAGGPEPRRRRRGRPGRSCSTATRWGRRGHRAGRGLPGGRGGGAPEPVPGQDGGGDLVPVPVTRPRVPGRARARARARPPARPGHRTPARPRTTTSC